MVNDAGGEYLFVGDDLTIYRGDEARVRIASTNDVPYFEEGKGIISVPKSRWELAQSYEKRTWMEACAHAGDDRNDEHAAEFGDYEVLRSKSFARAIELGCGPFTNLRVLGRVSRIDKCVLLDPLINNYRTHRHCTYRYGAVRVRSSPLDNALNRNLALRAIRRVVRFVRPGALEEGIPIERCLPCPIEEMPECGKFDLVVMINVLEHCFDGLAILDKVSSLCERGTVLVFHDRLYDAAEVERDMTSRFDAGHPLRLDRRILEQFLHDRFSAILEREVEVLDRVGEIDLTEKGVYFIGEFR